MKDYLGVGWNEVLRMIGHWAATPENGYLGSTYGGKGFVATLIHSPTAEAHRLAVAKLQDDLPVLRGRGVRFFPAGPGRLRIQVVNDQGELHVSPAG